MHCDLVQDRETRLSEWEEYQETLQDQCEQVRRDEMIACLEDDVFHKSVTPHPFPTYISNLNGRDPSNSSPSDSHNTTTISDEHGGIVVAIL